jgi:hypothetical protein
MKMTIEIAEKFINHLNKLTRIEQLESLTAIFVLFEYGRGTDMVLSALKQREEYVRSMQESYSAMP